MAQDNLKTNSKSHFFTIPYQINQIPEQAYGPQSNNVFNLSSSFTVSSLSKAFAICKGNILLQPHTDANKVNLILRPYTQPIEGVNIKYFVYRGLLKSGFFAGDLITAVEPASDFIIKITRDFNDFYANDPSGVPIFLAKYIGFDPLNQESSLLIDDFFFKESKYVESNGEFVEDDGFGVFELPLIDIGASLGNFAVGECAIDVVLGYGDYKPLGESGEFKFDLAYARDTKATITLDGTDLNLDKLKKEQIFQFLDIAAYYGSHTVNGTVIVDNSGVKQNLTEQAIYTGCMAKFSTKNKLYIYLQGDRTRSYNFYGNYNIGETSNSLKMGSDAVTLIERPAYENFGWPVLIESLATASLFLQFVTDNNVNTVLYGQVANIKNAAKNNFSNADDLLLPADENGSISNLTKALEFSNPIAATDNLVIGTFNIVLYQGISYSYVTGEIVNENNETVTTYAQPNFFDDIFNLIEIEPKIVGNLTEKYSSTNDFRPKLICKSKQVQAILTQRIKDTIETFDEDYPLHSRFSYITETIDILNNSTSVTGKILPITSSPTGSAGNFKEGSTYEFLKPYFFSVKIFIDNTETISGVILGSTDAGNPNKLVLGLSSSENEFFKELIETNNFKNARFVLQNVSVVGLSFQKFKAAIIGENSNGALELLSPAVDIFIYSLDALFYFSKDYSKYMKQTSTADKIIIDLTL